jgi:hypothetical protein
VRRAPTRTNPRNRCLSSAELNVRIHSAPAESLCLAGESWVVSLPTTGSAHRHVISRGSRRIGDAELFAGGQHAEQIFLHGWMGGLAPQSHRHRHVPKQVRNASRFRPPQTHLLYFRVHPYRSKGLVRLRSQRNLLRRDTQRDEERDPPGE